MLYARQQEPVTLLLSMMWTPLRQILTFEGGMDELASVVGLFEVAGTAATEGPSELLILMALFSVIFGFINLLPIPGLDGWGLLFLAIEVIRRRPVERWTRRIAGVVVVAVVLLGWFVSG